MSNKRKINKTKKVVKKQFKQSPIKTIIIGLFIIVVLGIVGGYLYINGYLDDFFNQGKNEPPIYNVIHEQNSEGYYYYTSLGFEENGYYVSAEGLEGDDLVNELNFILNQDFNRVSYGDARYILANSDRDPNDNGNSVRGMYDNDVIATTWIGTGSGAWQREHVWPNSKLGIGRVNNNSRNQGSDLHNLRAITGINQTRSNRYFTAGSGGPSIVGTDGFYPGDDHRGDVARIMFYMFVMYDFLTLTDDVLLLGNDSDTNYTLDGAYGGLLSLFIEWHKLDPVDEFEQQRNNYIASEVTLDPSGREIQPQGNRNPFIDRPDFVHLIWEEMTIEDLVKDESNDTNLMIDDNITFIRFYEKRRLII